jgi:hypothetical protein
MSSRSRRNAGAVRVVCRDRRHSGTREWEQRGYRHVADLLLAERAESSEGPSLTIFWDDNSPGAPAMKGVRREDGQWVVSFTCTCGRNPQRTESDLVARAQLYAAANPGRRAEIDLAQLG